MCTYTYTDSIEATNAIAVPRRVPPREAQNAPQPPAKPAQIAEPKTAPMMSITWRIALCVHSIKKL